MDGAKSAASGALKIGESRADRKALTHKEPPLLMTKVALCRMRKVLKLEAHSGIAI